MTCVRCGQAEVQPGHLFVVSHTDQPEFTRAIDVALREQGIDGEEFLGQLCEGCFEVATACFQEGARRYAAARSDLMMQRCEANLRRPLTSAERREFKAYLGRPSQEANS